MAKATTFSVWPFRFHFRALDSIFFAEEQAANIIRGAFGSIFRKLTCSAHCETVRSCPRAAECPYARVFEPNRHLFPVLPGGFAEVPRPFVFRAHHLNGRQVSAGQEFAFDVSLFEPPEKSLSNFADAFRELVRTGLGPGRGRTTLTSVEAVPSHGMHFDFHDPPCEAPARVQVHFLTPTELKSQGEIVSRPEFPVLFSRLRDRLSNLRACYQGGRLEIDFTKLAEAAQLVQIVKSEIRHVKATRQSSRTGQRHPVGGFVGTVEYAGDLRPFMQFLSAGQWTGVGRQTVWGKGAITVKPLP